MSEAHIEEKLLERYAMGVLSGQPQAAVDEHLLACPDCQSRLVQLDAFLAAVRPAITEMRTQPAAARRHFRLVPKLVWLAPVAAIAAGLLFVVFKPGALEVAPAIIQMRALRGPERAARLTVGQSALLVFDVGRQSSPVKYEIEVVDRSGKAVWTVATEAKGDSLSVPVRKLEPGAYWVRVYRDQPEKGLLEEYALRVERPAGVKN